MQYQAVEKNDDALRLAMIRLAKSYGRYGYRKVAQLLRVEGWRVNRKKVERLWREEGLHARSGTRRSVACTTRIARSFDSDRRIPTMSGASISFTTS
jgi:transposase InsO family protein